jgi:superfamily II DNA helicase RecQ
MQPLLAARDVMDREPYDVQILIRRHLQRMSHSLHCQVPAPILFIWPTGGGKSLVRDLHAIILGGFTITIVPLLSVGIDQSTKLKRFS